MKPARFRLVEVEWLDAQLHLVPVAITDLEATLGLATRHTIGWLVLDTDEIVGVASTWDKNDATVDGTWIIPKKWVKRMKTVRKKGA